ncbi:MAG TPA: DAK2 domain-containing protein, partial [Chloroflexota bacterium]|nr:DAK2 domain-containing protein [Chloroflexota bacterium]
MAVQLLRRRCETLNNLNVFPVPDGDTGTNMLLTMQAGLLAAADSKSRHVGPVASSVARGALLGARGNSGVILSQYLLGFARGLDRCDVLRVRALKR